MGKNFFSRMTMMVFFVTQVACAATATQPSVKMPLVTVYPTATAQSTATPLAQTSVWRGSPTYFNFDPKWTIEFQFLDSDWNLVVGARPGQFDQLIHRGLTSCTLLGGTNAGDLTSDYRVDRSVQTLGKTEYELSKVVRTKVESSPGCTEAEPEGIPGAAAAAGPSGKNPTCWWCGCRWCWWSGWTLWNPTNGKSH